jgi:hypothetical protein
MRKKSIDQFGTDDCWSKTYEQTPHSLVALSGARR